LSETLVITVLGITTTFLSSVFFFILGQGAERKKQSLLIRVEMLEPINEWLKGAEKKVSILGDTMSAIALSAPLPDNYSFDERRKASNFMSEKTNEVLGIIASDSLNTRKTKHLAKNLNRVINDLDETLKFKLLPRESMIIELSNAGRLTEKYMLETAQLKMDFDSFLQEAYSLIAKIKTSLM
jgi:hypothetical protein